MKDIPWNVAMDIAFGSSKYEIEGGEAWLLSSLGGRNPNASPVCVKSARKYANALVKRARKFWRGKLATDDVQTLVLWHKRAEKCTVEYVYPGVHSVPFGTGGSFGSGAAWGIFETVGDVAVVETERQSTDFFISGTREVELVPWQAVYTAWGDSINGGRETAKMLVCEVK